MRTLDRVQVGTRVTEHLGDAPVPPLLSLFEGADRSCLAGMVSEVEVLRREEPGGSGSELPWMPWMLANLSESKLSLPTWGACLRSMHAPVPASVLTDVF